MYENQETTLYLRIPIKIHFLKYLHSIERDRITDDGWKPQPGTKLGNLFFGLIKWGNVPQYSKINPRHQKLNITSKYYLKIYIPEELCQQRACYMSNYNYRIFVNHLDNIFYNDLIDYIELNAPVLKTKDFVWKWMEQHQIEEDDIARDSLIRISRRKKHKYASNIN